jgi:tetratricopeptide (TPR) repeat protein
MKSGLDALAANRLGDARSSLEQAARLSPKDPRPWLLLAETYGKQKNLKAARTAALNAERLGSSNPQVVQALGNLYATFLSDNSKAASLAARYAELSPGDTTAWRRLAAFCLNTGQFDQAIAAGERGLHADDTPEFHTIVGQAHVARKDWPKAIAELSAALKLAPFDEDAHFRLAQLYLVRQDFPSAVQVLRNARKTFDKSAQIELALGVAFYGLRRFPEAVGQFFRTIELAPDVPQPYLFLGRMMDHVGDRLPEVIHRAAAFEQRNPQSPVGYVLHAKALIAGLPPTGFPPEADTALNLLGKALALKDDDAEANLQAGVLLERKGDLPAAAVRLERSVELNAKDATAHFRLARVYERLGRAREAAEQRALHEKLGEASQR